MIKKPPVHKVLSYIIAIDYCCGNDVQRAYKTRARMCHRCRQMLRQVKRVITVPTLKVK